MFCQGFTLLLWGCALQNVLSRLHPASMRMCTTKCFVKASPCFYEDVHYKMFCQGFTLLLWGCALQNVLSRLHPASMRMCITKCFVKASPCFWGCALQNVLSRLHPASMRMCTTKCFVKASPCFWGCALQNVLSRLHPASMRMCTTKCFVKASPCFYEDVHYKMFCQGFTLLLWGCALQNVFRSNVIVQWGQFNISFHTHFRIWVILLVDNPTVTVKWRTAIKAVYLYFSLCPSVIFDILSCSLTAIFILTNSLNYQVWKKYSHTCFSDHRYLAITCIVWP